MGIRMFVTTRQAAKIMGYAEKTLRNWRVLGYGPIYSKPNRAIRYELNEIYIWMDKRRFRSTGHQV